MRKELFLAIFLGGFIGIAVAFGAWRFTNSFSKSDDSQEVANSEEVQQLSEAINSSGNGSITITRPTNNSVSSESTVSIAGLAQNNSNILIVGSDDYVFETENGSFEEEIEIVGGINQIPVYMFTQEGKVERTSLLMAYSSEIENPETAKLAFGTITDITETTLQVRNADGGISQIMLSSETSYTSTVQTTEDIEFDDLAIGDFITAIGQMDDDDVISAQRVIVSSPLAEETDDVVAYGTVQTLTNQDFIVVNDVTNEEWSIDATDSPTVTTKNDDGEIVSARLTSVAEEGDWIIIIGTMEDGDLMARRIHIL